SVWQLVHRAQEALIDIEPITSVVLRARYDQLRLTGAHIRNCEELRKSLDTVVACSTQLALYGQAAPQGRSAAEEQAHTTEARMTVGTVRQTLNKYRDE